MKQGINAAFFVAFGSTFGAAFIPLGFPILLHGIFLVKEHDHSNT